MPNTTTQPTALAVLTEAYTSDGARVWNTFGRICLGNPELAALIFSLCGGRIESLLAVCIAHEASQ
jgi:hypothetical protein